MQCAWNVVTSAMWSNEIRPCLLLEIYTSKLGIWTSWQTKSLAIWRITRLYECPNECLMGLGFDLAWYDLLWRRQWKRPRVIGCLASNGWKALGKTWFLRGKKSKRISWIRWLRPRAGVAKYVLINEEKSEYNKLYHHMSGQISRLWLGYTFFRSDWANMILSLFQKSLLEGICITFYSAANAKSFMPSWNSVQLFLGRLSWLKKSVFIWWV